MIQWKHFTSAQRTILGTLRTRAETNHVLVGEDEFPTGNPRATLNSLTQHKLARCVSEPGKRRHRRGGVNNARTVGVYRITLAGLNFARQRNLT